MDNIEEIIINEVNCILEHETFKEWIEQESKKFRPGGLVVINNSFVRHDNKSKKADCYVALKVDKDKNLILPPVIYTHSGTRINSDFKYLMPDGGPSSWRSLDVALVEQQKNLGDLVFVIIGKIKDSIDVQELEDGDFKEIAWVPALGDEIRVYESSIEVGQIHDDEAIWQSIEQYCQENSRDISPKLKEAVADAIEQLHDDANADLDLPNAGQAIDETITDQIVAVLKEQMGHYEKAIDRLIKTPENNSDLNEVLRLAYNFATDATGYLKLIISICDLKPVVLWGTLSCHYKLSEVFRTLPFTRSSTKAELQQYKDTIGDARNSAFHHLFPFKKNINIKLTHESLAGAELRIFSEHRNKSKNDLHYTDKPLAEVLKGFTRARERRITNRFWQHNLVIMNHTVELFEATASFLKHLHKNRESQIAGNGGASNGESRA